VGTTGGEDLRLPREPRSIPTRVGTTRALLFGEAEKVGPSPHAWGLLAVISAAA